VLDQLAEESRVQALRKDLDFRYVPCARMVQTDRHLLARVLRNFLSNALRYIAEGRVLLGCRRDPSGIRIEVWDTGPGIPAEEQEAIFVAFHRVAVAVPPAEQNGGLGLGLSSARISDSQRRDRLLLLNAFAVVLLTLLGAAGESLGMDRHLKSNTVKTRSHSLFRQGCMLYDLIPNMPENRRKPLVERYAELLHQSRVVSETFAIV
jgi:hypothetical protein